MRLLKRPSFTIPYSFSGIKKNLKMRSMSPSQNIFHHFWKQFIISKQENNRRFLQYKDMNRIILDKSQHRMLNKSFYENLTQQRGRVDFLFVILRDHGVDICYFGDGVSHFLIYIICHIGPIWLFHKLHF